MEAREKCSYGDPTSLDHLQKQIKRFLLIVSRVARLLECIEFDPLEFCFLLDFAEQQAKQEAISIDIPKYIISKLGIDKVDPFEEFKSACTSVDDDPFIGGGGSTGEATNKLGSAGAGSYSRASSITGANSSSGISSTDVGDYGSEAGSITSSVNANHNAVAKNTESTPCEDDFQEIKLISNGAYG